MSLGGKKNKIALFEWQQIRRYWDDEKELWYFSVVDIIGVLSGSVDPRNYWKVLKNRLKSEGSEVVTKCNQLKMTAEWEKRGVKEGLEFAILTDEITEAWAGLSTKQHKNLKGIKKENLRDNMTDLELVLNMLAETATTEISERREPKDFLENKQIAKESGSIAGTARKDIEKKTGHPVISKGNFKTRRKKLLP